MFIGLFIILSIAKHYHGYDDKEMMLKLLNYLERIFSNLVGHIEDWLVMKGT